MRIEPINRDLTVCQVASLTEVKTEQGFFFLSRTDEEISLVCETGKVPAHTLAREDGWRAFRIQGVLEFSLIGILSRISGILAEQKIGIFAVSTYNTDYILVKRENFARALAALAAAGIEIAEEPKESDK
ncbi:MAG: ACT domain-containing protein [Lachnospiraceae bacterium]